MAFPTDESSRRVLDLIPRFAHATPTLRIRERARDRYVRILRKFAIWADPDDTQLDDITPDLLRQYQAYLAVDLAERTVRIELSAIRAFCRWAIREGLRSDDPTLALTWPRIPRTGPRALKLDELRQLIELLNGPKPSRRGVSAIQWERNRLCIFLMLYTGMRLGETCALTWADVDLDAAQLWVRKGKGEKDRAIPMHPELIAMMQTIPPAQRRGSVIGSRTGKPLGEKTMHHIFARWLPSVGLEGITAHRLRHTCATFLRRYGADLKDVQSILGHESLETTEIYLGPDPERLRKAIDRLPRWNELVKRHRAA